MKLLDRPSTIDVRLTKDELHAAIRDYINAHAQAGMPVMAKVYDFRFDSHGDFYVVVQCIPTVPAKEAQA